MNKGIYKIAGMLCIITVMNSCKDHGNEYHSITDKIEAESKDYHGISITSDVYIDKINTIEITENGITFLIPNRKQEIKSFACSECHRKPLAQMQSKDDLKKAHWGMKLNHANAMTMNCITCHNADNMDYLQSLTHTEIDFNKSYKLCSQCHQQEFKDWTGGAHGKRLESWAPPRASMTCVNCHNPHAPSFKSKWPERYNTQKINERK